MDDPYAALAKGGPRARGIKPDLLLREGVLERWQCGRAFGMGERGSKGRSAGVAMG